MATKTLQTRLALRYDSYENWLKTDVKEKGGNLVLLAGEVALCSVPAAATNKPKQATPPAVLMKVGDGTTPFKDLPWLSGLAADVYAWAKQKNIDFADFYTNNSADNKTAIENLIKANSTNVEYQIAEVKDGDKVTGYKLQKKDLTAESPVWADVEKIIDIKSFIDGLSGSAAIASVANGVVTIKAGVAETNGVIANATGDDITLAKVATTGDAEDVAFDGKVTEGEGEDATEKTLINATNVQDALIEVAESIADLTANSKVTIDTTSTTEGYLKSYTIYQGEKKDANKIGTIDIPKDLVVTSGEVVVVDAEHPIEGVANGTYVKLTIANQTAPIYINVADLCDVYTAQQNAAEVQLAISATNEISATIVDASIAREKIDADFEADIAAVENALDIEHLYVAEGAGKTVQNAIDNAVADLNKDVAALKATHATKTTTTGEGDAAVTTTSFKTVKEEITAGLAKDAKDYASDDNVPVTVTVSTKDHDVTDVAVAVANATVTGIRYAAATDAQPDITIGDNDAQAILTGKDITTIKNYVNDIAQMLNAGSVAGLTVTDNASEAVAGVTVTVNETNGIVQKPVVAVADNAVTYTPASPASGTKDEDDYVAAKEANLEVADEDAVLKGDAIASIKSYVDAKADAAIEALNGSATIASVADDVVTLKAGITETEGIVANNTAADITLAKIAKTANVNDLVQAEGDYLVLNCGSSVLNV